MIKCITAPNVQVAIRKANEEGLKKENIISILSLGSQVFIIYE